MKVFRSISGWQDYRAGLSRSSIGFVPTMGALHEGHGSLVRHSVAANDNTVVSIFVNPTQFDEARDLQSYPVSIESDLESLDSQGVSAVLLPTPGSIYADGFRYRVTESELSGQYCGAHRAGHFDGVLTVVMRLLNLVRPQRAYFGEKDYQQLQLVRGMVDAFFMDVEIVACPTVREADGLAMSSRNRHLDTRSRKLASLLYRALSAGGDTGAVRTSLEAEGFEVDYVADLGNRRLAAVRLGDVRLIDNVPLEVRGEGQA